MWGGAFHAIEHRMRRHVQTFVGIYTCRHLVEMGWLRKMETPWVGMRMGAKHEDRQITKNLRTLLVEVECGLFL